MRTLRTYSNGRVLPPPRMLPPTVPVQPQNDVVAYDAPAAEEDTLVTHPYLK